MPPRGGRPSRCCSCRGAGRVPRGRGRWSARRSRRRAWASPRGGGCRSGSRRSAPRRRRPDPTSSRRSSRGRSTEPAGRPLSDPDFERRLVLARRRLESAARAARPRRSLGPLDVVPDRRLQGPRRRRPPRRVLPGPHGADPARLRALPPALRDEHPADLAPRPALPLDRPQRRDRHGPGQPRAGPGAHRRRHRGSRGGDRPGARRGRPAALARRFRLAVPRRDGRAARRHRLGPGLRAAGGDARGVVAAAGAASPRRDAPPGHRRAPRAVGRTGGDRLLRRRPGRGDPRPQRAAAGGLRGDVGQAGRASRRKPGRFRCRPPTRFVAGGSGRARCCSSTRGGGRSSRTPKRRPTSSAGCRSTMRRGRRTSTGLRPRRRARRHPRSATSPVSTPRRPASTSRRWSSRPTSRSGRWATTRRRRRLGRVDRPVSDHLRQSFAQVTNPPIDPERERGGHGPSGRPRPAAGAPRRAAPDRTSRADAPAGTTSRRRPRRAARGVPGSRPSGSTRRGRRRPEQRDLPPRSSGWRRTRSEPRAAAPS